MSHIGSINNMLGKSTLFWVDYKDNQEEIEHFCQTAHPTTKINADIEEIKRTIYRISHFKMTESRGTYTRLRQSTSRQTTDKGHQAAPHRETIRLLATGKHQRSISAKPRNRMHKNTVIKHLFCNNI